VIPDFVKIKHWEPVIDDEATGRAAAQYRRSKGVSQRRVAKHYGGAPSHLCEMERGIRGWSIDKAIRFRRAVDELAGSFNDII
jgi:transcriptional regulator with XRE-family HTH domain